jgi:MerR family transcriptional regulator, copper efflux regulator
MHTLTIGQLATRTDVHVETIRYYERRGLIPRPPRLASKYRAYPPETIARVRFIRRAQEVGFQLKEIKELLSLRVAPGTTCADIKQRTETKLAEVEGKILKLTRMKRALTTLKTACRGRGPSSDCPILDAFSSGKR